MSRIPPVPVQNDINSFVWLEWFRILKDKVNKLLSTDDTTPVGNSQVGTFIWNELPEELGTAGSKYIILGWSYTITETWIECRTLTGN